MRLAHLPLLAALLALAPGPARAQPAQEALPPPPSPWWAAEGGAERPWRLEVSLRAVAGTGGTSYALYDNLGFVKVSNLDFHGLGAGGGELHARASDGVRLFATATLGLGTRGAGTLQDEDFEVPGVTPVYSSTDSRQRGAGAWHLAAAVGYDVHQDAATRLGFFAGWRHGAETLHAWGCVQTAANPDICRDAIPTSVRVITARTTWTAPLLGVDGQLRLGTRLAASASVAYLPFVSVSGSDTHWLRTGPPGPGVTFSGPTPITASNGLGVQAEAGLRWRSGTGLVLGLGGRLLQLEARRGLLHFERSAYPVGGQAAPAQVLSLATSRREAWLEAGWRH
jgi:hypothetical protein